MKKPGCCFVLYLVILMALQFSPCEFQDVNDCVTRTKCNGCIQIRGCAWCSQKDYLKNVGSRCNLMAKLKESGCPASNISDPSSRPEKLEKRDLGGKLNIQVSPQRVKLHLRPGEPAKLRVTVRPAEDYPVDLYYLMDMSWSMRDDLANLKALGGKIAESIQKITGNFKLGFGSFVDKPVSPYRRTETVNSCSKRLDGSFDTSLIYLKVTTYRINGYNSRIITDMAEAGRGSDDNVIEAVQEIADGTELLLTATLYHLVNEQDAQPEIQAESRNTKKFSLHFLGADRDQHWQQELRAVTEYEERRRNPIQPYLEAHVDDLDCTPYSIPVKMRHSLAVGVEHPPQCFVKFYSHCQINRDKFGNQPMPNNRLQNPVTVDFSIGRRETRASFYQGTFSIHLDSDIESLVKKYAIYFY